MLISSVVVVVVQELELAMKRAFYQEVFLGLP